VAIEGERERERDIRTFCVYLTQARVSVDGRDAMLRSAASSDEGLFLIANGCAIANSFEDGARRGEVLVHFCFESIVCDLQLGLGCPTVFSYIFGALSTKNRSDGATDSSFPTKEVKGSVILTLLFFLENAVFAF
jgi:hypothetical protein